MLWELPDYFGPDVQFWNYYRFYFPKTFIPRQVENISSYKSIIDSLEQNDITLYLQFISNNRMNEHSKNALNAFTLTY